MRRRTTMITSPENLRRQLISRRWALCRCVWILVCLLHLVRRRNDSVELITRFVAQLGEWVRLRQSVHRITKAVSCLQNSTRSFCRRKKRFTERMDKAWQKIEDLHLSEHFRKLGQAALRDKQEPRPESQSQQVLPRTQARRANIAIDRTRQLCTSQQGKLNWKQFRIPLENRHFVIVRWYCVQLRQHVRAQLTWQESLRQAQEQLDDFNKYMLSVGGTEVVAPTDSSKALVEKSVSLQEFLSASPDDLLGMIAVAAHQLRDQEPFKDHPMNKTMSKEKQAEVTALQDKLSLGPNKNRAARTLQRAVSKLAGARLVATASAKQVGSMDVDELWRQFTPQFTKRTQSSETSG